MAPAKGMARNKREADYSNLGVTGRKTGLVIEDKGIRDEHGMEPMDGLFSSPQKPLMERNGVSQNSTITDEEDMEIGQSTIPEPTEVLTTHRTRNSKVILPPPRARSPMKTTLNSSPRRSMGPRSSPLRQEVDSPTRAMSHPPVNRRIDFSGDSARPSIEGSPQKSLSPLHSTSLFPRNSKVLSASRNNRKRLFDSSPENNDEEIENDGASGKQMNGDNGYDYDDSGLLANGDETLLSNISTDRDAVDKTQQDSFIDTGENIEVHPKTKGRRPRKNASGKDTEPQIQADRSESATAQAPANKKRAGRRPKIKPQEAEESQPRETVVPARRGRPPKVAKPDISIEQETESQVELPRPTKRARNEPVDATPIASKRKGLKPPPSERDPNAKITSVKKGKAKALSAEPEVANSMPDRAKPRSLFVLRSETPADDGGATILKSGRTSVKPMAFWRGERCIFGESTLDGSQRVLPSIKEVIRTEEIVDPRPKRPASRRGAGRKRRALDDVEEEDEELEPWETEEGVLHAEVMQWDYLSGRGIEEQTETIELAFAHDAIKAATREVRGADFRYAKTLTLPFFGSGMVDLPPGGEKRVKNSRKMQMVFFVFSGRVLVDVAGTTFSVGRGGMWQVPRGNFYSIANHREKPARIFFAQGCHVSNDIAADDSAVGY